MELRCLLAYGGRTQPETPRHLADLCKRFRSNEELGPKDQHAARPNGLLACLGSLNLCVSGEILCLIGYLHKAVVFPIST